MDFKEKKYEGLTVTDEAGNVLLNLSDRENEQIVKDGINFYFHTNDGLEEVVFKIIDGKLKYFPLNWSIEEEGNQIQTKPVDDIIEHFNDDCPCGVSIIYENDKEIITHFAMDGR